MFPQTPAPQAGARLDQEIEPALASRLLQRRVGTSGPIEPFDAEPNAYMEEQRGRELIARAVRRTITGSVQR